MNAHPAILQALQSRPMTGRDIAEALGLPRNTIKFRMAKLIAKGQVKAHQVVRIGKARARLYSLPNRPAQTADEYMAPWTIAAMRRLRSPGLRY